MWDLPGSGIETESPALAGGFFTAEPQGKPAPLGFENKNLNGLLTPTRVQ